jgi:hypothetical protein
MQMVMVCMKARESYRYCVSSLGWMKQVTAEEKENYEHGSVAESTDKVETLVVASISQDGESESALFYVKRDENDRIVDYTPVDDTKVTAGGGRLTELFTIPADIEIPDRMLALAELALSKLLLEGKRLEMDYNQLADLAEKVEVDPTRTIH